MAGCLGPDLIPVISVRPESIFLAVFVRIAHPVGTKSRLVKLRAPNALPVSTRTRRGHQSASFVLVAGCPGPDMVPVISVGSESILMVII